MRHGRYLELVTPGIPLLGAWIYSGPYEIPNYSVTFTGVFTNTTPTDAYRGAGRPEATYVLERTMDALAASSAWIPSSSGARTSSKEFPHTMASGLTIDSGRLPRVARPLLELLDLDAIRAEQAAPLERRREADRGRLLDLQRDVRARAVAHPGSDPLRGRRLGRATIRFQPLGSVQVVIGTSPHGQGHETTFAQIVADQLGVGVDDVEVLHGDTAVLASSAWTRTAAARSPSAGSPWHAGEKIIDKARAIVAHQLEVAEDDLEFADGTVQRQGIADRTWTIKAAAFAAHAAHNLPDGMEPGLEATAVFDPPNFSWPAGAHAAVVEVDTETGDTRLVRYVAVDDVGTP